MAESILDNLPNKPSKLPTFIQRNTVESSGEVISDSADVTVVSNSAKGVDDSYKYREIPDISEDTNNPNELSTKLIKIVDISIIGDIKIEGDYPRNFRSLPVYDLSKIRTLNDISFKFILSLKENDEDVNPILYTSNLFYEELQRRYSSNNPYLLDSIIKTSKIVVINLQTIKEKIESLRELELKLPVELFQTGVVVSKNLFSFSNYSVGDNPTDEPNLKSNPTYDLDLIVRYIDWVVSKPSNEYTEKLLDVRELGIWNEIDQQDEADTTPEVDEPPVDSNDTNTFPPIGRNGNYLGELVASGNKTYQWTGDDWSEVNSTTDIRDDIPNYNLGGFS
jgi:hypothetical protein